MVGIRFSNGALTFTISALQNTSMGLHEAGEEGTLAAGEILWRAALRTIGLRDHSLTDLRIMDHPYARRHRKIRVHTDTPWQVHRQPSPLNPNHKNQTDNLYKNTKSRFSVVNGMPVYEVYFDTNAAPEANFVVGGTKVMLPRDPLWQTAQDPAVQKTMMVAIIRRLGKVFRSKVGIRFGAGAVPVSSTRIQ